MSSSPASSLAAFAGTFGEWAVFSVSAGSVSPVQMKGVQMYEDDASEFMTVLEASDPAVSSISAILPSYTTFALSFPMSGEDAYAEAYQSYLDSKQMLSNYNHRQTQLKKQRGISPQDFYGRLGVREFGAKPSQAESMPL